MKSALCPLLLLLSFAAPLFVAADAVGARVGPWRPLLRSNSAPDWRGWKEPGLPAGWRVADGVLSKEGRVDDLVTKQRYGDFELEFDWRIGKGGNSGIFYRGTREYDRIFWSAPEYQLLDDANDEDGKSRLTAAGSDYGLYGVPYGVVQPYDHWNRARIVVTGSHVEHWLNGVKVVEYEIGSADWTQKVAASKFSVYPHYGLASSGFIGIQGDHSGALAIRNIRIRKLP